MCSAGSRLIVEERVRDEVIEKVVASGRRRVPADPLDAATQLGAIVDDVQLQTVLGYIASGRAEGAQLLAGGRQVRQESGGYYVEPTVSTA